MEKKESLGCCFLRAEDVKSKYMKRIKIYYDTFQDETGKERKSVQQIDDITWADLSMDDMFKKMNETESYIGEQVLYKRLHELGAEEEWDQFEAKIAYLKKHSKEREQIEKLLYRIGKREESYYLPEFLKHTELWELKNGFVYHILQLLLAICLIGTITEAGSIFPAGLLIVAAVNLCIYIWIKNKYEIYMYSLGSVKRLLDFCRQMMSAKGIWEVFGNEETGEAICALRKVSKGIGAFEGRKRGGMLGDPISLMQDYLLGITLYDVAAFNRIMKALDKKQDKLLLVYQFAGEIDMVNAVLKFREKTEAVCQPCFVEPQKIFMQGLRHPLLEHAVPSDIDTAGHALISGANASGKSTFMKAVAINIILAQTIHTCMAEKVKIPKLLVMTSMALRDDILSGESYYMREIKYLKRMLDVIEKGIPVFCVIDEILKGTNTKERLAASEAVLTYFAKKQCFVMVATHDMELIEKLEHLYECYYFESQIEEQDVSFDYVLHKGIGGKSNAIALLELLQYPKEITEQARKCL